MLCGKEFSDYLQVVLSDRGDLSFVVLAGPEGIHDTLQRIGGFSHGRNHNDEMLLKIWAYNICYISYGCGISYRCPTKLEYEKRRFHTFPIV